MDDKQIYELVQRYDSNKKAPLRTTIHCPCCGEPVKKNYQRTTFCSLTCKDFYWNITRSLIKEDYDTKMQQIHNFNKPVIENKQINSFLTEIDWKANHQNSVYIEEEEDYNGGIFQPHYSDETNYNHQDHEWNEK